VAWLQGNCAFQELITVADGAAVPSKPRVLACIRKMSPIPRSNRLAFLVLVLCGRGLGSDRRIIIEVLMVLVGLMPARGNEMSQTSTSLEQEKTGASGMRVDMKLEVQIIPVSDVERSKQFYERLGWRFDADLARANGVRIVQFTPPGSGCSVMFGNGLTAAAPGSAEGMLVVSDIEVARDGLVGRGIDAKEAWHGTAFPPEARLSGPDPKRASYGSFFSFSDPDNNTWIVQEVTTRLPGRI
jgi:catechol 2,3-dioxygenase-like lactoylglutathione lyase family enzyme